MIEDQNNKLQMRTDMPKMDGNPADTIPPVDRNDVTNLDEDALKRYILSAFMSDIADKQDWGWIEKKRYAYASYYGLKNEAMKHWPWEGASAFPFPLTPTITDTAWANINAGIWENPDRPVFVPGIEDEDIRPSKILEKFLNWQVTNDMDLQHESDKNVLRTFLMGTGIMKIMFDLKSGKVLPFSIDLENFYVPIDASGLQKEGTDHIIQIIPLSKNDLEIRKAMGIYRDPDSILPGAGIVLRDQDTLRRTIDTVSGTSLETKVRRDNYYIMEIHMQYIPPGSGRPLDLIVWMNPNGGTIQRIRKLDKGRRPFAAAHAYPFLDRFYSMGIPEKIRNIQEKLDYSDKQYTDALDRSNNPAAFVDDTDAFDRTRQQRVPGGIYPKGKGNSIEWEPQPPVERGFRDERAMLIEIAERLTGVIDVTQGRPSSFGGKTLGEVEIRTARADVRFSSIFKRFGKQWKDIVSLIYENDFYYMSKEKIVDVLGFNPEGYTLNEIFPVKNGELCNYNFGFSGNLQSDVQAKNEKKIQFYSMQMKDPTLLNDPASVWRVRKEMAEAMGVDNIESVIPRPKEANLMSSIEFIKRVVSGQRDLQVRPGIDTQDYLFEIQLFMKTQTFQSLEPEQQQILTDTLRRVNIMAVFERKAMIDLETVKEGSRASAMQGSGGPNPDYPPPPVNPGGHNPPTLQ